MTGNFIHPTRGNSEKNLWRFSPGTKCQDGCWGDVGNRPLHVRLKRVKIVHFAMVLSFKPTFFVFVYIMFVEQIVRHKKNIKEKNA